LRNQLRHDYFKDWYSTKDIGILHDAIEVEALM